LIVCSLIVDSLMVTLYSFNDQRTNHQQANELTINKPTNQPTN